MFYVNSSKQFLYCSLKYLNNQENITGSTTLETTHKYCNLGTNKMRTKIGKIYIALIALCTKLPNDRSIFGEIHKYLKIFKLQLSANISISPRRAYLSSTLKYTPFYSFHKS